MISSLSGYMLHGRGQSAGAASQTRPLANVVGAAPRESRVVPSPSSTTTRRLPSASDPLLRPSPATTGQSAPSSSKYGTARFDTVRVPAASTATTGRVVSYTLSVQQGIGADNAAVARDVGMALLDRRGWQGVDHVRFVQLTADQLAQGSKPQLTILMASQHEVDQLCAPLPTHGNTSCNTSKHVVLNYALWEHGVSYFKGAVGEYREYMVNHEVGHALGHGHEKCTKAGAFAPVMQQQTLGLQGCKPWPWPQRPTSNTTS